MAKLGSYIVTLNEAHLKWGGYCKRERIFRPLLYVKEQRRIW